MELRMGVADQEVPAEGIKRMAKLGAARTCLDLMGVWPKTYIPVVPIAPES